LVAKYYAGILHDGDSSLERVIVAKSGTMYCMMATQAWVIVAKSGTMVGHVVTSSDPAAVDPTLPHPSAKQHVATMYMVCRLEG